MIEDVRDEVRFDLSLEERLDKIENGPEFMP